MLIVNEEFMRTAKKVVKRYNEDNLRDLHIRNLEHAINCVQGDDE